MSTVTESKTIKLANDLVKCADFLNKHADLFDKLSDTDSEDYRLAYLGLSVYSQTVELYVGSYYYYGDDADKRAEIEAQQAAMMVRLRKAIGGKWSKNYEGNFTLTREKTATTPHVTITVPRSAVCKKVVTGTRTRVIPAQEEQTIEEEIVEWDCAL